MGTLSVPTVNFPSTATGPHDTICIDHYPEKMNCHDDAGGLYQGYAVYITATTQKNDVTIVPDEYGKEATQSDLYFIERQVSDIHQSYNFADEIMIENDPAVMVKAEKDKKYWLKVAALTVVEGTRYNFTDGLVTAIDDPTPDAVVYNAHCVVALAGGTTITGWVPFKYEGLVAIDST